MAKAPKLSAEEKLNKALDGLAPFEAELSLLLPAQVWNFVEALCRLHLQADATKQGRELVAQLALTMRQEALRRFGHDTLETFALARMLREGTARWQPKEPRLDAISHINNAKHPPHRLTSDQQEAAEDIREVWTAFGKFLEIAGRDIGGGSSSRATALGPVDVMGEGLWEHHRDVFKPWQFKASRTVVLRRTSTSNHLTIAAVVYKVLVEDIYPAELDLHFALVGGTALKALKAGLDAYRNPDRLDGWGKPPAAPQTGGLQAQTGAGGGKTPAKGQPAAPAKPKRPPGLWVAPRPKLAPGEKVKLPPRKKKQ